MLFLRFNFQGKKSFRSLPKKITLNFNQKNGPLKNNNAIFENNSEI